MIIYITVQEGANKIDREYQYKGANFPNETDMNEVVNDMIDSMGDTLHDTKVDKEWDDDERVPLSEALEAD